MLRQFISQKTLTLALAGALLVGAAAPGFAGPLPGNMAALGSAAGGHLIEVRWRHHRGGGIAAGIAAGLIGGALIGAATSPYYYYPPSYYRPPPPYYPYYDPYGGPVYVQPPPPVAYEPPTAPNGPGRMCWVSTDKDRGFGYWRPC